MKTKIVVVAVVLLSSVAFLAGYTRYERSHLGAVSSAGVWFTLGDGWRADPHPSSLYPARFVSQSGMVRVVLLPPELGDLGTAAAGLLETFEADPNAVKGSFLQEPFVTDSALRGIHVRFRERLPLDGGVTETECHHYLVRNHSGRFVAINYQSGPHADPLAVDQMIRNSLRLQ